MKPHFPLIIKLLFMAMVFINSCGSARRQPEPAQQTEAEREEVPSLPSEEKVRSDNQPTSIKMVDGMTEFSFEMFRQIGNQEGLKNFSFSPVSLNMAMAMVYSGAKGETRTQISKIMNFQEDPEDFNQSWFEYYKQLMNLSQDTMVEFNLANRVYLEQSHEVLPEFKRIIETYHGGAFELVDFIRNYRVSERQINEWVERMTSNRITDLIPEGTLDNLTRLVLVNAIYIKSSWKYPFDENLTREKIFNTVSNNEVQKKFMTQTKEGIPYLSMNGYSVLEMPYTTPELSLMVILPDRGNNKDIRSFIPDQKEYKRILDGLRPAYVHMEIPKLKVESGFGLKDRFREIGMEIPFSPMADFSGISEGGGLEISEVIQKVFFEMDEKGSEAAAATAIVIVVTSAGPDLELKMPVSFIANRPFIFILKENTFNTPLFIGQYVE
jgi:serpin B